ncbi:hypothetical protein [Flavobacterium sp. UMI-01]|uniref:hypothetical protein n=1 Tax=Flavobacterium sp. UMI-01 TaxID=1441053 RepID=UPI001C7CF394|nr:hypothetical protein [Flavobacterium sp. UMI-01]GIZ08496.1 hypothetical protein FUMI01_12230 [Flavobacterium sp. UMI-01]
MTTSTVLLIILSLIVAGGLSFFQYLFKAKSKSKLNLFLALLRFLAVFGILLLLINPIITKNTLEVVKPPLAIVVDNSSSINHLKATQATSNVYQFLANNKAIVEKFNVQTYRFDADFQVSNLFDFKGKQTKFDLIPNQLKNYHRNQTFPTVIITDGNQTSGNDYNYSFDSNNKIFPVVVGDTTEVLDLKIEQLNVNKYAFYKNQFPVEVFVNYSGDKNVKAELTIATKNSITHKQKIIFSPTKRNETVSVLLPANRVGVQVFKATISSVEKEKNTYNNTKNFAVEVLNQQTKILIVSDVSHPDIAALKRAIESNKQRKVSIARPKEISKIEEYAVCILYQPNASFAAVLNQIKKAGINTFTITGMDTDFSFLNQNQSFFEFKMSGQPEDFTTSFNPQFNLFAMEDIGFENFPPLENPFGKIIPKTAVSVLLSAKIRGIETDAPLLCFIENFGKRTAFLFGENSWKWRMQSAIDQQSFDKYDVFIDKIIQYLATNSTKKALVVQHERFYNSGESIMLNAQFFNKNYEFDEKAHLTISVQNTITKERKNYDLLKSNASYKVNLDGLVAGHYSFVIKELNTNTSYSSAFEILDFDIEKQFVNANAVKLGYLAQRTGGKLFYPNQMQQLVDMLLNDEAYPSIQKKNTTRSPLIEWYWLLILIVGFLSTEWFVRKYNGLL